MENNMGVSQKIKNSCTIESSNAASDYMPKGNENSISVWYRHSCVYWSIALMAKDRNNPNTHQQMIA